MAGEGGGEVSNLESIVPPVELCQHIPAGEFEDSAMVWEKTEKYFQATEIIDYEYKVVARDESKGGFPAPTLAEILESIGEVETWDTMTMTRITNGKQNLTTNALKRWFKVKGVKIEI